MAFELPDFTTVRVLDVRVLATKDRKPDDPPGAQLLLSANLPSEALSMFDGFLANTLYDKPTGKAQGELEGIESVRLSGIGAHVKHLRWVYEQTGMTLEIDRGLGGKRNIVLAECTVHRVSISPIEGSVIVQWTVDAPGLPDAVWSKLPGMKATDIVLAMTAPEVQGDDLADEAAA